MTADQPSPTYAIIVATKDRGSKIVPLMESVAALEDQRYEVIVVDQSADDRTEQAVAPFLVDDRVRYVRSAERGLSRGRNLAIAATHAPYLVVTDDDCIVPPKWLSAITAPFEEDERTGLVFCSVAPVPVAELGHTPHVLFDGDTTISTVGEAWRASRERFPLGAGMAIRRAMYDDVGGFDESLGAGGRFGSTEDSDLCWRGLLAGWSTVYTGRVVVDHDGFRDLDELRRLVDRDFNGIGGAMAKYLRAPGWSVRLGAAAFVARLAWHVGVALPARDVLERRRPRGFRRPVMLARGVLSGLRTPVQQPQLLYERSGHLRRR